MKTSKTLELTHIGRDSFSRPVYECNGNLYVDANPSSEFPEICTKSNNEYDGEPDWPIDEDVEVIFIPERDRW